MDAKASIAYACGSLGFVRQRLMSVPFSSLRLSSSSRSHSLSLSRFVVIQLLQKLGKPIIEARSYQLSPP